MIEVLEEEKSEIQKSPVVDFKAVFDQYGSKLKPVSDEIDVESSSDDDIQQL